MSRVNKLGEQVGSGFGILNHIPRYILDEESPRLGRLHTPHGAGAEISIDKESTRPDHLNTPGPRA